MSAILYELPDRYVLDTGEVVGKHIAAMREVVGGRPLDGKMFVSSEDLVRFAQAQNQTPILWEGDGEEADPDPSTYEWNIPEEYRTIDIRTRLNNLLSAYPGKSVAHYARLETELDLINKLGMVDFVRCLIWIVDQMTANKIVWGVGRGSSVESLVLFLIRIHRIDPVLNDIPLEHFFRSK